MKLSVMLNYSGDAWAIVGGDRRSVVGQPADVRRRRAYTKVIATAALASVRAAS